MSQLSLNNDRRFGKWPIMLGGLAAPAILVSTLCFHKPAAHAQGPVLVMPNGSSSPQYALAEGSSIGRRMPTAEPRPDRSILHKDPAEQMAVGINRLIDEKQGYLDATLGKIDDRLEVIHQCQENIDSLTDGVSSEGLKDLDQRIGRTRPLIRKLKGVIGESLDKIALLGVTADNLDRRIIQLHMQVTRELQPDPSSLLRLKKLSDTGVNKILSGIDRDDPLVGIELDRVTKFRANMQARIEAAEAKVHNRAADQGVEAGNWEDREHDRQLRHETADWPAQLRDDYVSSQERQARLMMLKED